MKLPLQITFRHMEPSEALAADIRERAEKLDLFSDQIMSCRVVVDTPHQHQHQGNLFGISVDVTVPGGEIIASREAGADHAHEDPYVAVRDAFNAVQRRLEDHARRHKQQVKLHEPPPHGRVARLMSEDGYGFIETLDGREIYFHRNSVLHGAFDKLEVGNEVRFAEEMGDEGPQASSVSLIGKHHIVSE